MDGCCPAGSGYISHLLAAWLREAYYLLLTATGALLIRVGGTQTVPAATTDTARPMAPAAPAPMPGMADSTHGKLKMKEKRGEMKVKP